MAKVLHFSGFNLECFEVPWVQTGTINNQKLFEGDLTHGVLVCAGPSNIASNDLIDSDGNVWHFRISSGYLYLDITKDNVTIISKQLSSLMVSGYRLGSGEIYSRIYYLLYDTTTGNLNYTYYLASSDYNNEEFKVIGISGFTTTQATSNIVSFPNKGSWVSGTSVQLGLTYDVANHLSPQGWFLNAAQSETASRLTLYLRTNNQPTNGGTLLTSQQIRAYFRETFDIEGGLITECTITLDRTIYFYTGSAITPLPKVVSINGNTLTKDIDYTLTYVDNVKIGTAQITITGIDLWSESARIYFTIVSNGDPYSGGGIATIGGGDGSFDSTSDNITLPSLPTLSALQSSLINLWAPSSLQLASLVSWLWSSAFDLDSLKKLFASPMDMIMGLSIVPVSVPTTSDTVKFGLIDSNVSMYKVTQQYAIVDCGDINLEPFWGSYLDYSPYTKIDLFLPFIGYVHLDPDLTMDSTINVTYYVDVLSGSCVAYVCSNTNILYTFMGNCATHIPISGNDWSSFYSSLARLVSNTATFAIGGANVGGVAGGIAGAAVGAASSMLTSSMKPVIGKSGSISSAAGLLNLKKPHLVINRPRQALPEMQNTYTGYPAFITSPLNSLIGYTEVEAIHLDNVPATDEELDEIREILHNGFII